MSDLEWWKKAVFYQIYLRSFADGNGDGIGDLKGICQKIHYLVDLGIDAIWLSPHYPSPLFDCGYDVADYTGVAPEYGTLDDFRDLLEELHKNGIRLILDLVLNHTSDQHGWFQESRSSHSNPKRDWYIWRDGHGDNPPNNWYSWFGGSAWEFDPETSQYYYHFFFKQQPDLNWRNPEVKETLFNTARYWLDMGVDGFRLDAIGMIYETENQPDHTASITQADLYRMWRTASTGKSRRQAARESQRMFAHQMDLPEIHGLLRELRPLIDEYPERVLVGETEQPEYYGDRLEKLHLVFNFPFLRLPRLTPAAIRSNQAVWQDHLPQGAWPCNTLGNHDTPRLASRYGENTARTAAALLLTLKGTPFLYNGDEIGQKDCPLENLGNIRDNLALWAYQMEQTEMRASHQTAFDHASKVSRDPCRAPMQWTPGPNNGFCPAEAVPWIPAHQGDLNCVAVQDTQPGSLLNLYRRLIRVRKQTPALITGDYRGVQSRAGIIAFLREIPRQTCLVVINTTQKKLSYKVDRDISCLIFLDNCFLGRSDQNHLNECIILEPNGIFIAEVDPLSLGNG